MKIKIIFSALLAISITFFSCNLFLKGEVDPPQSQLSDLNPLINKDIKLSKVNNLGGDNSDGFYSIIESGDYYIAVGCSYSNLSHLSGGSDSTNDHNFVIAKFNKNDLSLVNINNFGNDQEDFFETIIESENYYIAAGYSASDLSNYNGGTATNGNDDFVIAMFNKNDLSLVKINNFGGISSDRLTSVIESESYYTAVGYSLSDLSNNNSGYIDFVIAQLDKNDLSLIKLNNFGGGGDDFFSSIIESGDYYIVSGYSSSNLSSFNGGTNTAGYEDFVIAQFNKNDLSLIKINNFGGTGNDFAYSLLETNNYYTITGSTNSDLSHLTGGSKNTGNDDFVIAHINKNDLSLEKLNNFGGTNNDCFYTIMESDNSYLVGGFSQSDLSNLNGGIDTAGDYDFIISRINKTDLSLLRINNCGGTEDDRIYSLIESENNYICAGISISDLSSINEGVNNNGGFDFVIAQFEK